MLKTEINVRYSLFEGPELRIVDKAIRTAYRIAKSSLPKKTGKLQSCFHFEIIGDSVFLYIDDTCFYAEYLLEKPKTRTYWNDCRRTFITEFYSSLV